MGVTTKKNIIPIINGETIFPKNIPNLNHILFSGSSNFEFSNPRVKKISEIANDQILICSLFISGYKLINKNTTKKTIPKLLLDPNFISAVFAISIF